MALAGSERSSVVFTSWRSAFEQMSRCTQIPELRLFVFRGVNAMGAPVLQVGGEWDIHRLGPAEGEGQWPES